MQIERQLNAYMRRVEDVLGKGWEQHLEGQKLKADGDSFRLKLNTQELFDDWSRKVSSISIVLLVAAVFSSKPRIGLFGVLLHNYRITKSVL